MFSDHPMVVGLEHLQQACLLIPKQTGIVYQLLVGGFDSHLKSVEGYIIPIEKEHTGFTHEPLKATNELAKMFPDGCPAHISVSEGMRIENLLKDFSITYSIKVNWMKFELSLVSFLHVVITSVEGSYREEAILTWPNPE